MPCSESKPSSRSHPHRTPKTLVVSGYSVRNNDDIKAAFAAIFPDSNIAKMMILIRTKSMYAINHGLAQFFKSALMFDLQKSEIRIYSFDENLKEITQTCEMDLHLRY